MWRRARANFKERKEKTEDLFGGSLRVQIVEEISPRIKVNILSLCLGRMCYKQSIISLVL